MQSESTQRYWNPSACVILTASAIVVGKEEISIPAVILANVLRVVLRIVSVPQQ
jgi:hypothetical protein